MPLKPLYDFVRDDDGRPKTDRHGFNIPHKKAGQARPYAEYSLEEKKGFDDRIRWEAEGKKALARKILDEIDWAKNILKDERGTSA